MCLGDSIVGRDNVAIGATSPTALTAIALGSTRYTTATAATTITAIQSEVSTVTGCPESYVANGLHTFDSRHLRTLADK